MEAGTAKASYSYSLPSIIAITAALVSFAAGAFWGFILAVAAIVFGVLGVLLSLALGVRGGFLSILSLVAGGSGIVVNLIKTVGAIL